jgi:pyruvate/2-oxoglutarate dehydrogenase complex dihydrolipoamide acyltransferase (E2) component
VTIGHVDAQQQLLLRYTFDERVEDGLYCARALQLLQQRLEDPSAWLADGRSPTSVATGE